MFVATYRIYGLALASEIALDGLETSSSEPDALIRLADTPIQLDQPAAVGPWWEAKPGQVLVRIGNVGRFLVNGGREILVTPLSDSTPAELAYVLLHAVIGPLLHQRGTLLLHASAVQFQDHTIVLAGHAGAGKSTLLFECTRRGGLMVTDDLAPVTIDENRHVRLSRGTPCIHVWRETLDHYGLAADTMRQVRPSLQKFQVPVAPSAQQSAVVSAIVCIEPKPQPDVSCHRLEGRAAFVALRAYVRGLRIAETLNPAGTFRSIAHLADRVPVFRITRPEADLQSVGRVVDQICAMARP